MNDLNLMAIFAHVAHEGSFAEAARKLGTSRSAVSKAVAKLESTLGARLLNRTTRQLSLTEVGNAVFEHCHRIIQEAEQATRIVEDLNTQPRGTLRVAASVAFGTLHIAPAMAEFLERYPQLDIDMAITDRVVDLAGEGYDLTIRVLHEPPASMVARKLAPVQRRLCATPEYFVKRGVPQHPQDLALLNCLDYIHSGDKGIWKFKGLQGDIAVPVAGKLRINDDEALSQVVLGGLGCALLPTFIIGKDIQSGKLACVLTEYLPVEQYVYAIYLPNRNLPLKVRVLIDFLLERFGEEPYWDREAEV